MHPRQEVSDMITVIDITEQDLKIYGQWPWPRHILAMIHDKISKSGAIIVNYNILFAEADRMSGTEYLRSMPMTNELREQLGTRLLDTDAVFSAVLKEWNNSILMMSVKNTSDAILPSTTPIIAKGDVLPWLYNFGGIVPPHNKVSAGTAGMGVNVTSPEPDAVVRKQPMLIAVGNKIYPSMTIENLRMIFKSSRIKVVAKSHGIDQILVTKKNGIPVNHLGEMYIHYADPSKYEHISISAVSYTHLTLPTTPYV